jgi:hypothetical protein
MENRKSPTSAVVDRQETDAFVAASLEWLDRHGNGLEGYEGEWVALTPEGVVAHGESYGNTLQIARERGIDQPLMVPVIPYPFFGG